MTINQNCNHEEHEGKTATTKGTKEKAGRTRKGRQDTGCRMQVKTNPKSQILNLQPRRSRRVKNEARVEKFSFGFFLRDLRSWLFLRALRGEKIECRGTKREKQILNPKQFQKNQIFQTGTTTSMNMNSYLIL